MAVSAELLCMKMAVVLFSKPQTLIYKCGTCSFTVFVSIICCVLTWIVPCFIIYGTGGVWKRITLLNEKQARISFTHQLIMEAISNENGNVLAYSTLPHYNDLYKSFLRVPTIKAIEVDEDGDGIDDRLSFQLLLPITNSETIYGIKILLFFNYLLENERFVMETVAYLDLKPDFLKDTYMEIVGNLKLIQSDPLPNFLDNPLFNVSVVNGLSYFATSYELFSILENYNKRKIKTELEIVSSTTRMTDTRNQFVVEAVIHYQKETNILISTNPFSKLKWALIQYIYVALLFIVILYLVNCYIFTNELLTATVYKSSFQEERL